MEVVFLSQRVAFKRGWDEQTGDVSLKQVVETYINETDELVHVTVAGEEIFTTPSHPFYSPVKGWTDAVNLRVGDILVLVNGEYVVVEKVQHEILESPVKVYNFQVEDYHTYYVSDAGVLVHNMCDKAQKGLGNKRIFNNEKINGKTVSMDLERGATGNNIHLHVGTGKYSKYTYDGISNFYNEAGKAVSSKIQQSPIVQKGLDRATRLILKGW